MTTNALICRGRSWMPGWLRFAALAVFSWRIPRAGSPALDLYEVGEFACSHLARVPHSWFTVGS
jgi:hypothetical protein